MVLVFFFSRFLLKRIEQIEPELTELIELIELIHRTDRTLTGRGDNMASLTKQKTEHGNFSTSQMAIKELKLSKNGLKRKNLPLFWKLISPRRTNFRIDLR